MSELTKQVKIKERQAEYWMKVCHFAIGLFPESFWNANNPKPSESAETICRLLQELADRRQDDEAPCCPRYSQESVQPITDLHNEPVLDGDAASSFWNHFNNETAAETGDGSVRNVVGAGFRASDKDLFPAACRAADSFYKLRGELIKLHLLSPDATDQTAFITVRDILNSHAQDKSFEHRYPHTAYEIPSNQV